MLITAIGVALIRSLFAAVMLYGIFSLLTATVFVILDAVDVAFTEAAVGTSISTILMLSALSLTGARMEITERSRPILALCVALGVGAVLAYGLSDLPLFTDPFNPSNLHIVPRYLEVSPWETGIPNVVTSVLASYRGYDTLGEVVVIFTAGVGVISLLGKFRRQARGEN